MRYIAIMIGNGVFQTVDEFLSDPDTTRDTTVINIDRFWALPNSFYRVLTFMFFIIKIFDC